MQVDMRLDKRRIHGKEFSVAFSRSISVEFSEGSIVSTCTFNFENVTSLISDVIFLYQLAQAHPYKVLHFLVHMEENPSPCATEHHVIQIYTV